MKIKVIENNPFAAESRKTFGWFKTIEEAKQQIALAKATSGLPGYVNYSHSTFDICTIVKGFSVYTRSENRIVAFVETIEKAEELCKKYAANGCPCYFEEDYCEELIS